MRPATPKAHGYTVRTEAKSPLDHGAAKRVGINSRKTRMNDIQSRNLQTKSDSRDRGNLASIARPRKL
eukprot:6174471-Pleurochrysis_carterae.AAC.2